MKKLLLLVLPLVLLSSCKKDSGEKNWVEDTDMLLDQVLNSKFRSIVNVPKDSRTYKHLFRLSEEAMTQATGKDCLCSIRRITSPWCMIIIPTTATTRKAYSRR